jgi:hypothetical protein
LAAALSAAPQQYHLRYAPRIGWLEIPVVDQLQIFADWGFRAFEYNGLPRLSNQEIAAIRKKMDQLGMSMGTFVVNAGGWKGDAMVDPKFHAGFLADVKRAAEIKDLGNEVATVCSGLSVKNLRSKANEKLHRRADARRLLARPYDTGARAAQHPCGSCRLPRGLLRSRPPDRQTVNHGVRLLSTCHQRFQGNLIGHLTKHWDWIAYFRWVTCRDAGSRAGE